MPRNPLNRTWPLPAARIVPLRRPSSQVSALKRRPRGSDRFVIFISIRLVSGVASFKEHKSSRKPSLPPPPSVLLPLEIQRERCSYFSRIFFFPPTALFRFQKQFISIKRFAAEIWEGSPNWTTFDDFFFFQIFTITNEKIENVSTDYSYVLVERYDGIMQFFHRAYFTIYFEKFFERVIRIEGSVTRFGSSWLRKMVKFCTRVI